jgi:putative photosynthetic complex assembly protein
MSEEPEFRTFPRPALIAGFALAGFVIAGAGFAKWTGIGAVPAPEFVAVESRALTFADAPGGRVLVRDATTGSTVRDMQVLEGGFVRVVLRGFARTRKLREIGPEPHFVLMRNAEGKLAMSDPSTGQLIRLGAFGKDNMNQFAMFLPGETRSAAR